LGYLAISPNNSIGPAWRRNFFKAEPKDFLPRAQQVIIYDFKKTLLAELERG
jgi:hypothetical protein